MSRQGLHLLTPMPARDPCTIVSDFSCNLFEIVHVFRRGLAGGHVSPCWNDCAFSLNRPPRGLSYSLHPLTVIHLCCVESSATSITSKPSDKIPVWLRAALSAAPSEEEEDEDYNESSDDEKPKAKKERTKGKKKAPSKGVRSAVQSFSGTM